MSPSKIGITIPTPHRAAGGMTLSYIQVRSAASLGHSESACQPNSGAQYHRGGGNDPRQLPSWVSSPRATNPTDWPGAPASFWSNRVQGKRVREHSRGETVQDRGALSGRPVALLATREKAERFREGCCPGTWAAVSSDPYSSPSSAFQPPSPLPLLHRPFGLPLPWARKVSS